MSAAQRLRLLPLPMSKGRIMNILNLPVAAALIALMQTVPSAPAQIIPIVNPGFESVSRPLELAEQTNGIGGSEILVGTRTPFPFGGGPVDWSAPVTVPGWRTIVVPFRSPGEVLAGVFRPTDFGGTPFVTGIEGDHVLAVQAAVVGQETAAVLQPDTTYNLSFLAGISPFDSDYFFAVSLTAIDETATLPLENQTGVSRLTLGTFFPPDNQPDGVMRRYEFSYTTPETLPPELVGAHIGINVFGSDGIPRVIYDDFALTVSTLGEAPALSQFGLVTLTLLVLIVGTLIIRQHSAGDTSLVDGS